MIFAAPGSPMRHVVLTSPQGPTPGSPSGMYILGRWDLGALCETPLAVLVVRCVVGAPPGTCLLVAWTEVWVDVASGTGPFSN